MERDHVKVRDHSLQPCAPLLADPSVSSLMAHALICTYLETLWTEAEDVVDDEDGGRRGLRPGFVGFQAVDFDEGAFFFVVCSGGGNSAASLEEGSGLAPCFSNVIMFTDLAVSVLGHGECSMGGRFSSMELICWSCRTCSARCAGRYPDSRADESWKEGSHGLLFTSTATAT